MKIKKNDDLISTQSNTKKRKPVYSFSRTYPAYLILIILLVLSYFIYDTTKQNVAEENRNQFEKATKSVEIRLQNLLQNDLEILQSMRGLYDMLPTVVRDYFEIYATVPVNSHSSIKSIAYIPYVESAQKKDFIFNTYSIGYYFYKIHPEGERAYYYPVQMIVPFDNYKNYLLGYDIATNLILKEAYEQSREENRMISTPVFNFELRNNEQTIFVFSPIYTKNSDISTNEGKIKNFVACLGLEINSNNFFKEALAGTEFGEQTKVPTDSNIIFKFYDYNRDHQKVLIYESQNSNLLTKDYKPLLTSKIPFDIANREISLEFYTSPSFQSSMQTNLPIVVLIVSLLLSFALFGFILSIITSRARAIDLAERMTRSQRRIMETTRDIIASMDFQGNWKTINNACSYIFGYGEDEFLKLNFFDLIVNEKDRENLRNLIKDVKIDEESIKVELQMKKFDNTPIWMRWSLVVSLNDRLIYAIGSDITLEKQKEEDTRLRSQQIRLASFFIEESAQAKTIYTIKTNHQLRNSLTSVLGYLQLLDQNLYDDEKEMNSYVKQALESSEEIYTYLTDIMETTETNTNPNVMSLEYSTVNIGKLLNEISTELSRGINSSAGIVIKYSNEANSINITTNLNYLKESLEDIFTALSENLNNNEISVNFELNNQENSLQLQLVSKPNPLASEMIKLYKNNQENLIETIKYDKGDVLFRLAASASRIHTLNGQIIYDLLEPNNENIAIITLGIENIL